MVAPMVIAAGIGAAGSILGGLFGSKKKRKESAPVIPQFVENPQSREAVNTLFSSGNKKETQASFLTQELLGTPTYAATTEKVPIYQTTYQQPQFQVGTLFGNAMNRYYKQNPTASLTPAQTLVGYKNVTKATQTGYAGDGLLAQLQKAPEMGAFEQTEYANAADTYAGALEAARINAVNDTAQSLLGLSSQFGLSGNSVGGSGSRALSSAITAKNQANLNAYASDTAEKLLNFRSGLLSGVYQRLVNRYNATVGLQGQLSGQGSAQINTGLSYNLAVDQAKSGVNVANSQLQAQSNLANQSSSTSLIGSAISAGAGLIGQFIGKKG